MPSKEANKRWNRETVARRRADWLAENGPCRHCGSWENLEVDHADPSTKVDHKVWSWSETRRNAELAKCRPLCHCCHAIKTATECAFGERNGVAVLTEAIVREIRASREPVREIAQRLGVSATAVQLARTRQTWKHVDSRAGESGLEYRHKVLPPQWRDKDKRMASAVRLRAEGRTLHQIGAALATSHETVRRDLARWNERRERES